MAAVIVATYEPLQQMNTSPRPSLTQRRGLAKPCRWRCPGVHAALCHQAIVHPHRRNSEQLQILNTLTLRCS
jgi:hypothetical protein